MWIIIYIQKKYTANALNARYELNLTKNSFDYNSNEFNWSTIEKL